MEESIAQEMNQLREQLRELDRIVNINIENLYWQINNLEKEINARTPSSNA